MFRLVPVALMLASLTASRALDEPKPVGRLVDLGGGYRLHLHCTGRGAPTVVVETGLGDFSFDWMLVQQRVTPQTRICTYDRGGYAWSDAGPGPRTFAQLNLELHSVLAKAGEAPPYVLVGHSFGGGVVRAYALERPSEVAGLVYVDIVAEQQYIAMGPRAGRIGDDARNRPTPVATLVEASSNRGTAPRTPAPVLARVDPPYDRLPSEVQRLHAWAAAGAGLEDAENSQREWSAEYFARWAAAPQDGSLGAIPLVVLTRAVGGFGDHLGKPASELERIRLDAQRALARLSSRGSQRLVNSGHQMHLEVPDQVSDAILEVVTAARRQ